MSDRQHIAALTLPELLISIAIGMALIAMAWSSFSKTKSAAQRAATRVEIHQSAAVYREVFQRDFANLSPATAMFGRSLPQVTVGTDKTDTIELVFMRAVAPLRNQFSDSIADEFMEDYHWVRWRFVKTWRAIDGKWTVASHILYRSRSSPSRRWLVNKSIIGANLSVYDALANRKLPDPSWDTSGLMILNLPRPLRDASAGVASLEYNKYNTPTAMIYTDSTSGMNDLDIGDLTDLDRNSQIITTKVNDMVIGWVDGAGQMSTLLCDTASDFRINGLYADVVGPSGNNYLAQLRKLPRTMRVAMNIVDGDVTQDFSFSIAALGLRPQYNP